jgi:cobalt-zinc-cadmium efflux system protein
MVHSHEHHHEHVHELTSLNKSFIIGITLNILFVLVEFGIGFYYDSLGLLSDAGHNLGDVASLVLAMLAFRLAKVHPNSRYTYGYKKKYGIGIFAQCCHPSGCCFSAFCFP